jgi:hypothetical protein
MDIVPIWINNSSRDERKITWKWCNIYSGRWFVNVCKTCHINKICFNVIRLRICSSISQHCGSTNSIRNEILHYHSHEWIAEASVLSFGAQPIK